jgi:hypothetical protein
LDRKNNPYAKIQIDDATGSKILYCTDASCIQERVEPLSLVHVEARIEYNGGSPYLACKYLEPASSGMPHLQKLGELPISLSTSPTSLRKMIDLVDSITCPGVRSFVCNVILHPDVALRLLNCPVQTPHQKFCSNDLMSLSVSLAQSLSEGCNAESITRDIALSVGLLHNIGMTQIVTSDSQLTATGYHSCSQTQTARLCDAPLKELEKTNRWVAQTLRYFLMQPNVSPNTLNSTLAESFNQRMLLRNTASFTSRSDFDLRNSTN